MNLLITVWRFEPLCKHVVNYFLINSRTDLLTSQLALWRWGHKAGLPCWGNHFLSPSSSFFWGMWMVLVNGACGVHYEKYLQECIVCVCVCVQMCAWCYFWPFQDPLHLPQNKVHLPQPFQMGSFHLGRLTVTFLSHVKMTDRPVWSSSALMSSYLGPVGAASMWVYP